MPVHLVNRLTCFFTSEKSLLAQLTRLVGVSLLIVGSSVAAVDVAMAQQSADPNQRITVSFDNADVRDVIRWASDLTTKNIIVHPSVIGKKVTVMAGEPMSKAEAWQVFLSSLQVNGIAVMETKDTVKVMPEADAKTEKIPVMDAQSNVGREDMVVRIVKVKNLSAQQLISLLKPLTPNTAHFAAYPETNSIILADRAGNVQGILDIISRIDQAGTLDIDIVRLEFASAKDVSKILTELVQRETGGDKGGAGHGLKITADERSNSILMTGDPVLRSQMQKMIQRLDMPLAGEGNTQVIYLNYMTAKDMKPILEGVGGGAKIEAKDGGALQDVQVSVQALEQTNAVVITAPPAMLNTMKAVIAKLDVRRQQVLVEALIVEVNEDKNKDLGVFWNEFGGRNLDAVGSFGTANASLPGTIDMSAGGLSLAWLDSGGSLRGLVRMLEKNVSANVLSTPTIIALDNEEARILVGSSVPFKKGYNYDNGNNNNNNNNYYNNNYVQIERQDIGVELKVTPRINLEGVLTLEIEQKVESINESANVGGDSGASDLITNKREIKTKALVRDNQILVLGGLMQDDLQASESGVPFLSKVPIAGRLFRGTAKTSTKKNLMVFIHPRILPDDLSTNIASRDYYEGIREQQRSFNKREFLSDYNIHAPRPALKKYEDKIARPNQIPQVIDEPVEIAPLAESGAVEPLQVPPPPVVVPPAP